MPAALADRHVDLAHHHGGAVAHVARIALNQIGALVLRGGEARGIIEDTTIAAVRGVVGHVARPLRLRIALVMDRQVAVAVDRRAERQARVLGEERLEQSGQRAIRPIQHFGAILHRVGA